LERTGPAAKTADKGVVDVKRLAFVVTLLVLGVAPSALTQSLPASFAFTTFDAPASTLVPSFTGAVNTENGGINTLGVSVGDFCDAFGNNCHGYQRSAQGRFTLIDVPFPNAHDTIPSGINASGVVVGQYFDLTGRHCFVLDASGFTSINVPFPGVVATGCRAINDLRQIVGLYDTLGPAGRVRHGFLLSGGVFTAIDGPVGTTRTIARGINNAGQIVGRYVLNGFNHGFLLDGGRFIPIDFPFAKETVAAVSTTTVRS
jgi:uncharacterized membrane protein